MRSTRLLSETHSVVVDGRTVQLPFQAWQVLAMLLEQSPDVVRKQELIDRLWPGRQSTGEKGTNHALWQIRTALGDEPGNPRYIQTIPRVGYRWIGPPLADATSTTRASASARHPAWHAPVITASLLAMPLLVALIDSSTEHAPPGKYLAADAYLQQDRVVVEMTSGCELIIEPTGDKRFSRPVLSSDGRTVAFEVYRNDRCELATVDINDRSRQVFGVCPSTSNEIL